MNGRDLLKAMAQQAKERLRGKTDKIINFKNASTRMEQSNVKTIIITQNDDKLNSKMKNLIESECICPITELMDFSYYKTLSKEQKERYFFTIADRFRKYKLELENEKFNQVCEY